METRKFESDIGKEFLPPGKDLHHQQVITSDLISENATRIPQIVSVAGTGTSLSSSHIHQYQQTAKTRINQAGSVDPQGMSSSMSIVRLPVKNRSMLDRSQLKSQNITLLQRELVNTKSPREVGNQYISLPLRIENLSGNLQLVAAKPGSTRGQTSLIPVVVSGDEIYQFQGQGAQKNVVLLTSSPRTQSASSANQNFNLTGSVSQPVPSATAIGSQNLNLTSLLSQPAQSAATIGSQNINLTGLLSQSATAIENQNLNLTGLLSQTAQSPTAIRNQNLNLTGLLSQPAQSPTAIGNQNLNLTGLLATTSKLEAGLTTPVNNIQTGFQEAQHLNSYDNTIVNSSPIMAGSIFSNQKASVTQTVSSPVYKSKLEKAMAQNLLIQSSAKNTRNKTLTVPVMSQKSATIQTPPVVVPEATPIKPDPYNNQRITQEHIEEPAAAVQFLTNSINTTTSISPIKPALKVSKVAEYYKSLVAGKGIQYVEKQTYLQPQMDVTAQSVTDNGSQYTIIADPESLHMNQKITDVFSIGQNTPGISIDLETMNNSEFAYPLGCFPVEQPEFVIREKRYEDYSMGRSILEMLWSLREDSLFCDAILYAGSQEIKLHKVVLIGASPEIHKRVFKTVDQELKLMLPSDIIVDSIMTFVYYIYHGVVKLTLENVQHLYRLSGIFGMTQLSKHCYDFCKVAKMGHLIIGSPYQEAAKQIQKETTSPEVLHSSTATNQFPVPHAINTASDMFIPPKVFTRSKPLPAKKENRDTLETISQEIDWVNNDPSQSNIPIRKRGRNRKAVQNEAIKCVDNEVVKKLEHEIYNQNFNTEARDVGESNIGNRYVHPKKSEASKFGISPFETAYEIFIENDIDGKNTGGGHSLSKETVMSDRKGKQAEAIEDFLVDHLESLPDPLVTGKLDESELLKLKEIDDKSEKNQTKKLVVSHTVSRPVMTRFRTRSANISVVEAATQMKAKSNDLSRLSTPKNRRKRVAKKTSPNAIESSDHPGSEIIKRLLSNPARSLLIEDNMTIDDEKNLMIDTSPAYDHNSLNVKFSENSASAITMTKELTDLNPVTSVKEVDSKNIDMLEQDSLKKRGGTAGGTELNDSLFKYLSAPKKARLRKSTLDQHELKDTVYMRPPPKKRAKEIREMMKNEEDGKLKDDKTIIDCDRKFYPNDVEKENASKTVKTKRKRPRVKNDIVMAKVYEIEKFAMAIDAEKIYRCTFCSVEFKFAKRAVTHLIGTHDIDLDDTPNYVSVEKKTEDCKELQECDICGFKPKESGTYYIHYHKYFRHRIPLPKGWQAFKCDLCQKEFFTKFQLREHKLIHFEDNPFVCELCGSGFRSRTCLNSHVFHKHSSVRKHKCPDCPKTFKTATQVKVHQRVHSGEKPFLCPTENCMYRSTTRGNMKLHLSSKHKLVPSTVKALMEELEASEAGPDSLIYADNSFNQEANKEIYQGESTVEAGDFGILVQSSSLDNSNVTSNREPYVTGQIEILSDTNVMVSSYSETVPENNPIVLNARDYSLVNQGACPNPDLDMVMPGDNHILEGQNIPRHVEMLIQDAHRFMQHQDNSGQSQFSVSDFQQNSENEILDMRNRLPDQSSLVETYENPNNSGTSRYIDTPQVHGTHKVLDPHSKEARLMIREAFEGHTGRSLLKSSILQGNQDSHRLEMGTRHLAENANISESANLLNEAEKLVIDLHESSNHQIAGSINPEDEVVQRLRSQIQQLRDSNEQFRDSNSAPLFRTDHSVPEILLQSITSQHQTMETAHFQTYHHSTGSPPAYSSSSHGLITLPVSDIATQSNVTLTPVSQDETQGQIHSLQSVAVMQGQGYPPVASQSSTSQFTPDGGIYHGYYQEQYDIENY